MGVVFIATAFAVACVLPAAASGGFATYQPATVAPPIARPFTRHCTVELVRDRAFAGDAPAFASYAPPPACPGPWSKIVLELDTHVKGVQYDRIGALWLDRAELLRFSTAEPTPHGIAYRVEKDVTAYAPLMRKPGGVTLELANYVNATDSGVYRLSATLTFYESGPHAPPAKTASDVVPVEDEMNAQPWDAAGHLRETFDSLPRNIVRARLDLYATNHGCDEFWYANSPDAYVKTHPNDGLCGGGTYREIDISIDGRLASVVYPFPYIWTGGVNPLLWRPLSAIDTLDVPAYRVDLDPWSGLLSNGHPHTIAIDVYGDRGSWPLDANLLLWRDPHRARTGGAVTVDTIAPMLLPHTRERPGERADTFHLSVTRAWRVSGYVDTSKGRVWHTVESRMIFENAQILDLATGKQDVRQRTSFVTSTLARDRDASTARTVSTEYPLIANSVYPPPQSTKPYALVIYASVRQARRVRSSDGACNESVEATAVLKRLRGNVDAVARGHTTERNVCTGIYGRFSIRKSARNGVLSH